MKYTPDLTTLEYVKEHRRLAAADFTATGGTTEAEFDALITGFIHEESANAATTLNRVCMPYVQTKLFDYAPKNSRTGASAPAILLNSRELWLRDDDLLAITTLTNDGTTITSGDYALRPANMYPFDKIILTVAGGLVWTYTTDTLGAISIAGIWGYVPHYGTSAWKASGADLSAGAITTTTQSSIVLALGEGALFKTLQYIRIESEVLQVTDITTDTLTVTRGELGTTAATHTVAQTIDQFHQLPDLEGAIREIVVYRYLTKDRMGARVQLFDGGGVIAEDLDPNVIKKINKYKRLVAYGV